MSLEYGAKLSNIIKLKGKKSMKKLVVVMDGNEYDPVVCKDIDINISDDVIILTINSETEQVENENLPTENGIAITSSENENEIFPLTGEDLDTFVTLSEFRIAENTVEKKEGQKLEAITIESEVYDIQDLQSVSSATLDIIAKEQEYIKAGYKAFKTNNPKYIYESNNKNNFKLVETIVLCKVQKEESQDISKTKSS